METLVKYISIFFNFLPSVEMTKVWVFVHASLIEYFYSFSTSWGSCCPFYNVFLPSSILHWQVSLQLLQLTDNPGVRAMGLCLSRHQQTRCLVELKPSL